MKKIALLTSVAGLVMMTMNTAQAADGTINFTGEVVTTTCKVDTTVAGAAKDGVKLPNVANNQLATVGATVGDRKSTRLNSSHLVISYAVFCLKKKKINSPRL